MIKKFCKKIFFILTLLMHCNPLFSADLPWSATSGTVPDDGNAYLINSDITLTGVLKIEGLLSIETGSISVPENFSMHIAPTGQLINKTTSTINIDGTVYNYNLIRNGTSIHDGLINITQNGKLFNLNGTILNYDSNSTLEIKSGGTLYNYYGTIETEVPAITNFDRVIEAGGTFVNVRGNHQGLVNKAAGGNFFETEDIYLDSDLDLEYTWSVTNNGVAIHGQGNLIRFLNNGQFYIKGEETSLMLDDVTIRNFAPGIPLSASDHNSTFSMNNCKWIMDGNTSFTMGQLNISGLFEIEAKENTFSYETIQTSVIESNGMLSVDSATLSFNSENQNPIFMEDETAAIEIKNTDLIAAKDFYLSDGTLMTAESVIFRGNAILDLSQLDQIYYGGGSITRFGSVIF